MTESVAYPGGSARRQSIGEEVLNAISHGIGAVMAVIGTVLLVLRAKEEGDLLNIISVAMDSPGDVISALSGKLGRLEGVTAKTVYAPAGSV